MKYSTFSPAITMLLEWVRARFGTSRLHQHLYIFCRTLFLLAIIIKTGFHMSVAFKCVDDVEEFLGGCRPVTVLCSVLMHLYAVARVFLFAKLKNLVIFWSHLNRVMSLVWVYKLFLEGGRWKTHPSSHLHKLQWFKSLFKLLTFR